MTIREYVINYYPNAKIQKRDFGKEYYQIVYNNKVLGQGKSKKAAWTSAKHNIDNI